MSLSGSTRAAIDDLLSAVDRSSNLPLDVDALLRSHGDIDAWKFLCGVADRRRIAFHGTGDSGIESFEPRRPVDLAPFGDQEAVFATSDPIWAMFYAIVDRGRYEITLNNGCILLLDSRGNPVGAPRYYFSISRDALQEQPWRDWIRLLPAVGQLQRAAGRRVRRPHGPHSPTGEPGAGRPVRAASSLPGRLSLSRADSRPRRRTAGRIRPSCDGGRPVARLSRLTDLRRRRSQDSDLRPRRFRSNRRSRPNPLGRSSAAGLRQARRRLPLLLAHPLLPDRLLALQLLERLA